MFSEEDLLPLSGLHHMAFCERRWALVQLENVWEDNRFTAEGKVLHERAHSGEIESRPGILIRRSLPLHSLRLGLSGQADIVEFHPVANGESGISIEHRCGFWRPVPVEYKRSRDKAGSVAYRVQLCAQALCLSEMLSTEVPVGAVYDGATRRRQVVPFTVELRNLVESLAAKMHELFNRQATPLPIVKKACAQCSLRERCQPEAISRGRPVDRYLSMAIRNM